MPGSKSIRPPVKALGCIPAPIAFSEAFAAGRIGVVDGLMGAGAAGYHAFFRDVTRACIPANTLFEVCYMIISNRSPAELAAEDQQALRAGATVFEADLINWERRLAGEFSALGTDVVKPSGQELAGRAARVRLDVWPVALEDVGADRGQGILDRVGK